VECCSQPFRPGGLAHVNLRLFANQTLFVINFTPEHGRCMGSVCTESKKLQFYYSKLCLGYELHA